MINLNTLDVQEGKLGRPFRNFSVLKGSQKKWIAKKLRNDWFHFFKYIDDGSLFCLHYDLNGQLKEKLSHEESLKIIHDNNEFQKIYRRKSS